MKSIFCFLLLVLSFSVPAGAEILALQNGDFEEDFANGWTMDGYVPELVPDLSISGAYVTSVSGNQFALLKCGGSSGNVETSFCQLTQYIDITPGQKLRGYYFFATGDYTPYNDTAFIKLTSVDSGNIVLEITKSVADVGNYGAMSGWGYFETRTIFTETNAGRYELTAKIRDEGDTILSSYLALDKFEVVPEPATMVLLSLGGMALRFKKK